MTSTLANNPLIAPITELIDYARVQPAHIEPAVRHLIDQTRAVIDQVAHPDTPASWSTVIEPLEDVSQVLWRAWSVAGHLNAVINSPELREAYNATLPLVTEFSTWVGLHRGLYEQYAKLRGNAEFDTLTPTRQRIVELALRDFRLSGVELEGEAREEYARISDQQAQASQKFSENALDSVDAWFHHITDNSLLDGLPDYVVSQARETAVSRELEGWVLTLKMPCYIPVMQYARNASVREALYRGYATIASEHGNPALDNSALIEQLLDLRARESALLGYQSFAHMRLETRMADTAEQVVTFLRDLAARAKPHAQKDLQELKAFAASELGMNELSPWDIAFVSERLREARYNYSEQEVKQYFTEPQVLQGLFHVVEKLFAIQLTPVSAPIWHPDVRVFSVTNTSQETLGTLYMDLYARQGKQSGAWVDSERTRRRTEHGLQTPVVYLTCNFSQPQNGQPALFSHDDVITLFHESGHALHALLSRVDDPGASAFSSVEWDAIELPSQFMENFCWEWEVIHAMSAHVDTGEPLPRTLYDKLVAARNFQSGMQMLRQVEFSLFDMIIHHESKGLSIQKVMQVLNEVRAEIAVIIPPEWHRFPHNFSHLFAGGYGAGYYSYKWAEVLSSDAYAVFEEQVRTGNTTDTSVLDPVCGARFLTEVLAVGGSRPAAESFKAFRGRDPSIEALLRHSGLTETSLEH